MPIDAYLNQKINVYTKATRDQFNQPVSTDGREISARFREKNRSLRTRGGTEYNISAEIWIHPTENCLVDEKVVYDGKTYLIVQTEAFRNKEGIIHHRKLFVTQVK